MFKKKYRDNYRELEQNKGTLKNSAEKLKKEFVLEVVANSFSDRYIIKNKYLKEACYIGCDKYIKDNYYDLILMDLEREYRLLVVREVIYRLENDCNKLIFDELDNFVQKEFNVSSVDDVFNQLTKKNIELKEKYFSLKKKLRKDSKKYSRVKSVK